jgi:hypothetical protein
MKRDGQHITMDHHFTKRLQQLSSLGHRLAPSFQVLGSTDDLPAACNGQSVSFLRYPVPSIKTKCVSRRIWKHKHKTVS